MRFLLSSMMATCFISLTVVAQDAPEFSGPQVGEKLAPFKAKSVFGESIGEEFDPVEMAKSKPVLILFVHELTRPSIGLVRTVANYAASRKKDGLSATIVFLGNDVTELEAKLNRAKHALPQDIPIGISVDGMEGPGAYGLNRKMTLTGIVANENKVTANFAIVQPSLAVDAVKFGAAIANVLGDEKGPTLQEMGGGRMAMNRQKNAPKDEDGEGRFREMLAPVIQKDATKDDVDKAAKAVEELLAKDEAFKTHLIMVTNRIIDAGRLETYGTEHARTYLRKWSQLEKKERPVQDD